MKKLMKNGLFRSIAVLLVLGTGLLVQQGHVDAASLTTRIFVQVSGALSSTVGLSDATSPLSVSLTQDLGNGVGAGQGNVLYTARRTLSSAATDSLDFVGGGLTDTFGAAIAPARLRAVYIASDSGNTTNLTLFGDANSIPILNTAATTTTMKPGGAFLATWPDSTGIVVTAGTGDIIKIVNGSGASATYNIIVIGTSS